MISGKERTDIVIIFYYETSDLIIWQHNFLNPKLLSISNVTFRKSIFCYVKYFQYFLTFYTWTLCDTILVFMANNTSVCCHFLHVLICYIVYGRVCNCRFSPYAYFKTIRTFYKKLSNDIFRFYFSFW